MPFLSGSHSTELESEKPGPHHHHPPYVHTCARADMSATPDICACVKSFFWKPHPKANWANKNDGTSQITDSFFWYVFFTRDRVREIMDIVYCVTLEDRKQASVL